MLKSASVVVVHQEGYVLGITRGHNLHDITFPGGGRESFDKTIEDTAIRELKEETGAEAHIKLLTVINTHAMFFATTVYLPEEFYSEPFEGFVGWYRPERFTTMTCKYREHQKQTLELLGWTRKF